MNEPEDVMSWTQHFVYLDKISLKMGAVRTQYMDQVQFKCQNKQLLPDCLLSEECEHCMAAVDEFNRASHMNNAEKEVLHY